MGKMMRNQVKAFRDEAYAAGDFLAAAIAEVAMDRHASALDARAKLSPEQKDTMDRLIGTSRDEGLAAACVEAMIADAEAQS
jgi:hypothetical protein